MKRIITLLILFLMTQFAFGQIPKMIEQVFEKTKTNVRSKLQEKRIEAKRHLNFNATYDSSALYRRTTNELKTLDSLVSTEWDDDLNVWRPSLKEEFTYDSEDRVDEVLYYIWNVTTSSWGLFLKDEYDFDTNGNLVLNIKSYQFAPNVWTLGEKVEYFYNSSGNLIQEVNAAWDSFNNLWVNTYKHEVTYDSNQMIILDIGYEWFTGSNVWVNSYKDEFFYNMPSVLTSEINSYWNYSTNQWDLISKWEYFYGGVFSLTQEILFKWDTNSNTWINDYKYDYEYDYGTSFVVLLSETSSVWDMSMNQWEPQYKDEYQYDVNENRTLGIYSEWTATPSPGAWVQYYKDEYIFDLDYDLSDLIVPFLYVDDIEDEVRSFHNMLIGYLGFEYENMVWVDTDKILFFYSDYTNILGVNDNELVNALKVYPNPVTNILLIESEIPIDKVEIYSLLGHKVKEIATNLNALPVFDMASGIYILKITAGSKTISKRIIKR